MRTFFIELVEYNQVQNRRLLKALLKSIPLPEKARELYSHILNAHYTWNCRLLKETGLFGIWQLHVLADMAAIDEQNHQLTTDLLDNLPLDTDVEYHNSKGQLFRNSFRDIIFHIINHSTYHRGQIALLLRQAGQEPVNTDYIFFKR